MFPKLIPDNQTLIKGIFSSKLNLFSTTNAYYYLWLECCRETIPSKFVDQEYRHQNLLVLIHLNAFLYSTKLHESLSFPSLSKYWFQLKFLKKGIVSFCSLPPLDFYFPFPFLFLHVQCTTLTPLSKCWWLWRPSSSAADRKFLILNSRNSLFCFGSHT